MLDFFRKYQKHFFIVIAAVVISSFVFFGAFGALNQGPVRIDPVIGKSIDGSSLKLSEIASLSRFIAADQDDVLSNGRNTPPNLLNDGVVRKDILAVGVAEVLVKGNYEVLKSDLEQRIQRVKSYRSYEHPETPFLSAKAVWQRFLPAINTHWGCLQSEAEMSGASFAHLAKLYELQNTLPAEWLRRILMMQEQQYNWLHPDQRLRQNDLALFGFHSLADWFGKNFVDLSAEFIHNAAIAAEEKGYKASLEEAKADLQRNFTEAVKKLEIAKVPVEFTYQDQLRILGMDENEAAAVWRKILLFRRYFADVGNSVFLDRMAHTEFSSIANEKAVVDLYEWPSILQFNSAYDVYAFETYLKSVAPIEKGNELALPTTFFSIEEIGKKTPELIGVDYKAKVFAVDKREVALKASLKEVWAFEVEDATWARLKESFPAVKGSFAKNGEERFATLEKIDPNERAKIDSFARLLLVDQHSEWVQEALDAAKGEEKTLSLSGGKIELPYVDDPARLGTLFTTIPEAPETTLAQLQQFASKTAFFRFENIEKLSDAKIKTFAEAINDRSLTKIVDKALEAEFMKLQSTLPKETTVKEFSPAVKEEMADALLITIKKQIEKATNEIEGPLWARRMGALSARALLDLQKDPNDPKWLGSVGEDPLFSQLRIQRTEKQISRTVKEDWMSKQSFVLDPDQWSSVHMAAGGGVVFMYVKTRQAGVEPIVEQLVAGRQILSSDVQRILAEKILTVMKKKHAVIIPLQTEQE
jgi:hypothetical protein